MTRLQIKLSVLTLAVTGLGGHALSTQTSNPWRCDNILLSGGAMNRCKCFGNPLLPSPSRPNFSIGSSSGGDFDKPPTTKESLSIPSMDDLGAKVKSVTTDLFTNLDTDRMQANILDGEVGDRGEAWTAVWLILVGCILFGGIPFAVLNNFFLFMGGPGLMLAGGVIIAGSLGDLGDKNLTPFLSPTTKGSLIDDGLYSMIRHPIYAGLIALCAGFSIITGSASRLVITALLIFVLDIKSDKEEEMLTEKYPDYSGYKRKVTGKFLPGDWTFKLFQ